MEKPHLYKKDEFKKVLADYKVSDAGRKLLEKINLVLLVSPTSAGRNTIIDRLAEGGNYEHITSDTTRPRRMKDGQYIETNGVEYWFRSEDEVLEDLKKGLYLEAELLHEQQVSGISLRELEKASQHHKIAINEVDHGGIANIKAAKPDTVTIMILPPSPEEWMRRLKNRSDISDEEIKKRLTTAKTIFEAVETRDYYKIVINDDLDVAVQEVKDIVENDVYTAEQHQKGVELARELLGWVERELAS